MRIKSMLAIIAGAVITAGGAMLATTTHRPSEGVSQDLVRVATSHSEIMRPGGVGPIGGGGTVGGGGGGGGGVTPIGPPMTCEEGCAQTRDAAIAAAAAARAAAVAAANAAQAAADAAALANYNAIATNNPCGICVIFAWNDYQNTLAANAAARNAAIGAANMAFQIANSNANDDYDVCVAICGDGDIA